MVDFVLEPQALADEEFEREDVGRRGVGPHFGRERIDRDGVILRFGREEDTCEPAIL